MAQTTFSIGELRKFDFGISQAAVDKAIQSAVQDCLDRPGVKTARKIALEFTIIPIPVISGSTIDCESVQIQMQVTSKRPSQTSKVAIMQPLHDGRLVFNPDDPDNPEGETLFNDQEKEDDEEHNPS